MTNPVIVVDYDPQWAVIFAQLRSTLAAALGELAVAIEHIGSTAVPGMPAKPIIDIDAVIPSATDLQEAVTRLATLGYTHQGDLGISGREAFTSPHDTPAHHLYVCSEDSDELVRHRLFRDYLISNSNAANAYGSLKKAAAALYRNDRAAYTQAKSKFVTDALRQARIAFVPRRPIHENR
jgi:GrpB-like predicted nucleotidyltransferase (UPF0157 family)